MACRYTYNGKTYSATEFDDMLRTMQPSEATKYMPSVQSVPSAPFVTDTKSWTSLALKRMIAYAVDNNFDKIGWTTGEQQAARYDLSKQVDSIHYAKRGDEYTIKVIKTSGGAPTTMGTYTANALEDVVGKEVAKKIIDGGGRSVQNTPYKALEGIDLKVGGEGMKAYYDQIVPQVANDILKKIGGSKVGNISITTNSNKLGDGGWKVFDEKGALRYSLPSEELAQKELKAGWRIKSPVQNQQGITITPEMRAEVQTKGLPLFQPNRGSFSSGNFEVFNKDGNSMGFIQSENKASAEAKAKNSSKFANFSSVSNEPVSIIRLLESANITTIFHELAHYFFDSDIADASRLVQKEFLTKGEVKSLDEMHSLFNFYELAGDLNAQLREWHSMGFEKQREMHETFAESFELYLLKGKAPSIELQSLFQSFSHFMLSVYESAKELLRRNPRAKKFNPELTRYFDRMLATEEQIELAEQSRSMMPLFEDLEKSGMSPEAFAKYHEENKQSSQTAIEELRSKAVSDLGWIRGAYGKEVAKLQKKAKEARQEVRMDAHRDVMTQPISIAWRFLTKRLTVDDKIYQVETPKSDYIDESVDSLFVAIAKLGGLNKDETIATWGTDKADKPQSGKFGKPVWRVEGGRSIDNMAEVLGQYGYLERDENGKVDLHQFEEMFAAELSGDTQHSIAFEYKAEAMAGDQVKNPQALEAARIDLGALLGMGLPDEIVNKLKANGMTAQNGLAPDLAAEILGYESGDELVRALAEAESPSVMIEKITDQRMLEQHGELSSPEQISQAADIAIHNKVRAKLLTTEVNALATASGNKKLMLNAAKILVANQIAEIKIRDLRPSMYTNAAARAAKLAEKAFKNGDSATAYAEKRNQLINTLATKSAYDVREEVEKALKYAKKLTSETALKNMRGDAKSQLLAVLDRFDLRKSVTLTELDKEKTIADWAKAEAERLAAPAPILSEQVLNEEVRTHYKNLTVQQFRGLIDSLEQLEHMARREHKAYITIRGLTLQEEVGNSVAEIRAAWPKSFNDEGRAILDTPLTHDYAPSLKKKIAKGLQSMNAEFVPMEELVDQLTAGKFGLLHDSLFGRLSDAADRKSIMAGEIRDRLKPAYDGYSFFEKRDFSSKSVSGTGMTRENLVMLALYYGNVEGRQRLASQGLNDTEVQQRLRHLTDKDINLMEAIWSLNDDYIWPMYAALNERTQGKAPAKVVSMSININGREMKGGYVKLVYDAEFDETTRRRDSMDDAMAMIAGTGTATKTAQGSSIERLDKLAKMPLLELRAVSQAVNEHMHDIAFREAVADTVRVLREAKMMNAIKAVSGMSVYTELLSKVNEIAARPRDPSGIVLRGMNIARKNTVVVLMSGIKTALVNYSGLIPALTRVNAGSLVKNIAKVHSWRMGEMINFAKDNSEYMRERNQQFTSDLQHEMASLTVKNRILPEMGTFLILMRLVDQVTSTSVWLAAYEDGQSEFKDHDRAVEYANNITRSTQGAGREVDTSKIMTRYGPWSKPFTMFYSFFNRQLALLIRQGVISQQQWNSGKKAEAVGKFTAAYIAIVVIPALINDLATGKCDKAIEGDEGWTRCMSKAIVKNMSGFVPIVREFVPYVWGKLDDEEPDYGLRVSPTTAYFEGVGNAISSTSDVLQDEGDAKDTKAIFMGLAFAIGLPGLLMWNTVAGTEAVINEDAPPQSMLFGPPKK